MALLRQFPWVGWAFAQTMCRRNRRNRLKAGRVLVLEGAIAVVVLSVGIAAWGAEPTATPPETVSTIEAQPRLVDSPTTIDETLSRLDGLIVQLDARAKDTRARAEDILELADVATDADEQARLEELYGRMGALARRFDRETLRLRELRNELAAARDEKVVP